MFISGTREWAGRNARTFLMTRTMIEQELLSLGYEYFYGGIVSKCSIYEEHFQTLGERFQNIFMDFSYRDTDYILAPEYTFRVYEYLRRHNFPEDLRRVFYSQEMMRNETETDIQKGKTFSFWQIGYEIFGCDDRALSIDSITTLWRCLRGLPLTGLQFRISDKRIFASLCNQHSVEDRSKLLALLEACNENGEVFYDRYTQNGGDPHFAKKLRHLLKLANNRTLTLEMIKDTVKGGAVLEAIADLKNVSTTLEKLCGKETVIIVPLMPKTWDAYTTFIYDARVDGYDKAIAGGGNLFIDASNPNCVHSGAGIGVTRIAEYLISKRQSVNLQNAFRILDPMITQR